MNLQKIFINPSGRLRSGWRLLIFVGLLFLFLFLLTTAVRVGYAVAARLLPGHSVGPYFENVIYRLILLGAALIAGFICTRWLEGLPWRALGLWLHVGWLRDLFVGSLIGLSLIHI